MRVYSPVSGTVLALESVPDPVFAGLMLGPGSAIEPVGTGTVTIVSPIAGTIVAARSHAVFIGSCLVHAGVDTFTSDALTCLTEPGAQVNIGTPLIAMDVGGLGDLPSMVMATFPEHEASAWNQIAAPGTVLTAGTVLGRLD